MSLNKAFTIFGGTGDLTFRKLMPAQYNMTAANAEEAQSRIIIIGRRDYTTEQYCELVRDWVKKFARLPYEEKTFEVFAKRISYFKMDISDLNEYTRLSEYYTAENIDDHVFYLAVAPKFFGVIASGLKAVKEASLGKVILEKPFGEDLESAKELNKQLETFFPAENIYRIDHYLGKEMVRNIQTIRFTNPIFANLWNSQYIESVQISAFEDLGIGTRGGYYDTSGALKDMVQNHLFQILSIVAMEWPEQFSTTAMHDAQLRVLRALRPVEDVRDSLVLGQYKGYRQEKSVPTDSTTETYAALRLFIDNERWWNTPFYIRTGKKLRCREMQIAIVFRQTFISAPRNILIIKIQPNEGVHLQFNVKTPGDTDEITQAKMDFSQSSSISSRINTPEAYERLITACIKGERSWFSQWDQIETSWDYIEHLKDLYRWDKLPVFTYEQGSDGPAEADNLLKRFGDEWVF